MTADYSTPVSPGPLWSLRRRLLWFFVALAAAGATASLGFWQLGRARQKVAAATELAERGALAPLASAALARREADAPVQWQRHITLEGRWMAEHTVWLMNRTMAGRSGFFVLTPLQLADGDAVVVQRGWLPRDNANAMKLPPLHTPTGIVRVTGRLAPWPSHWVEMGRVVPGPIRQNLMRNSFAVEVGVDMRPSTLIEDENFTNKGDTLMRQWTPPALNVQTNYGYAFQWFAISGALLALYVWVAFFRERALLCRADETPADEYENSR